MPPSNAYVVMVLSGRYSERQLDPRDEAFVNEVRALVEDSHNGGELQFPM